MSCPSHPQWVHDREDCPICKSVDVFISELKAARAADRIEIERLQRELNHTAYMCDKARGERNRAEMSLTTLRMVLETIIHRIENGHRQSIGSIDNVRMVQFGIDEVAGYRAALESK